MLEKSIQQKLVSTKKTLALAESCTGGRLAARLTAIPGASDYFLGSLVVYSNEMKATLLHVPGKLIKEKGAVSKEVAEAMLLGLFKVTNADYAVAVTGIAGPGGGTTDKPVGTIWAAIGARGKAPQLTTFVAQGAREEILTHTTNQLLELFFAFLKKPM